MSETHRLVWADLERIRESAPLVHNITNFVVMNTTANALLALGASPVMAHALEEVEEMVSLARALVINIGTLSAPWIEAMLRAGRAARERGVPVVLDPVGSGATQLRTATVGRLLAEAKPTIVRGNASEIRSLVHADRATKGVDSAHAAEDALAAARAVSNAFGCVVSVSGEVDVIVSKDAVARVRNGHPWMTRVTGMGCTATALTGAFVAVSPTPFDAAVNAMAAIGVAGELAAARSRGPGSFQLELLDALFALDEATLRDRVRVDRP